MLNLGLLEVGVHSLIYIYGLQIHTSAIVAFAISRSLLHICLSMWKELRGT